MSTTSSALRCEEGVSNRWRALGAVILSALLTSVSFDALAANNITDVSVSKGPAGRTLVKITTSEPLAGPPAAFMISNPPRLALDFPETQNSTGKAMQESQEKNVRSINVVQAGNRTRLVVNLANPQNFETQVDGKTLLVTLTEQAIPAAVPSGQVSHFAESKVDGQAHSLRDVDFRRGKAGEGRIVVELSDNSAGIDIRQQGKTLVVDFLRTSVPRNLERRLDVGDFATPVSTIDTFTQGENTRMVIEPRGLWEHSAYQSDNRFIVEIKPVAEDPTRLTQGSRPTYNGEKLSLNFQNIEVRAVLQVIADFTGLNIITSDTVGGSLTLRLKDVPWDQALDIILQTKGLDMRKNGNVVLIAPREELAVKEQAALKAKQDIADVEPLQTESFRLNYQRAQQVALLLRGTAAAGGAVAGGGLSMLSKRGTVSFDPSTNTLFVRDTAGQLDEIRRIINKIDVATRQVMIEARIVIADERFSRQLGARFGVQSGWRLTNTYNVGTSGTIAGTQGSADAYANGLVPGSFIPGANPLPLNVNLPVSNAAGSLALSFLNLGSGNLVNLELSALEANNRGKVLSNPRVITSDNEKAEIVQGTQIPYSATQSSTGGGQNVQSVSFKDVNLGLTVTPRITPDGRVIMTLEVKKDTVGQFVPQSGGGLVPSIDTKRVTTQIAVGNGETAVLGGVYEEDTRNDAQLVPFLGQIPILGNIFKTTTKTHDRTELLIFITPRVVNDTLYAVK
jgi:type IV pilus assembly protein PilQ